MRETHKNKSSENQDEDIEFIEALRTKVEYPIVKRKVMDNASFGYRKYYRYGILWRNMKTRVKEYKEGLFGSGRDLEITLASVIVLFILGTTAYYYYTKSQSNSTNIIVDQGTPAIKLSPSPTNTPIAAPTPIKSIDSDFVKSAENNNNDNGQQNRVVENNEKDLNNKRNSSKKRLRSEFEEIALLRTKKINLLSIETIYVSEKINTELREELNSLLRKIDRFKLIRDNEIIFTQPDATFQFSPLDPQLIVLTKKGINSQIWQMPIDGTLLPKEQASTVILSFMESVKEAEQNTKRNIK